EIESSETLFKNRLSIEDADRMIGEISDAEIKNALFDIEHTKALRPDGFTLAFFKKAWSIIRADICKVIKEFFVTGKMLEELNATVVSLIPKVQTPNKPALGRFVSCNQSAFIPGRHIQDNIMLTQEIIRGYNRKDGPKRVAFKINIQKAYDTVNWAFTLNVNGDRVGYFKGGRGLRQ
nr:hypothetical protein [Tanacetum cinerariifolium]GEX85030.1 hypothetical protein [Tanacetum cinerariifolium]